jgi:DNA gyrase subunit A
MGRDTQGVKVINVSEGERLIGIERIASIDEDGDEGEAEEESEE